MKYLVAIAIIIVAVAFRQEAGKQLARISAFRSFDDLLRSAMPREEYNKMDYSKLVFMPGLVQMIQDLRSNHNSSLDFKQNIIDVTLDNDDAEKRSKLNIISNSPWRKRKSLKVIPNVPAYLSPLLTEDSGAECTVTLFADLPVDNDEEAFINADEAYAGHCFLQLSEQGERMKVSRLLGFYPADGMEGIIFRASSLAKYVNDERHKYNASFTMNVSHQQLIRLVDSIDSRSERSRYDIQQYNCADFALACFNLLRTADGVYADGRFFPGTLMWMSTPQAVFKELKNRKKNNDPESSHITIATIGNYVQ